MKISFEERYFSCNRIILLASGLWPYQQSKLVCLQITFFSGILLGNLVFQVYKRMQCILILYATLCTQFQNIIQIKRLAFNANIQFLIFDFYSFQDFYLWNIRLTLQLEFLQPHSILLFLR